MNGARRECLVRMATGTAAGVLLGPLRALAAASPPSSSTLVLRDAVAQLTGGQPLEVSRDILITAHSSVENRRLFPIAIHSNIERTDMIALFVEGRELPLAARFQFGPGAEPYAYFYLRMWQSTVLHAVVGSGKRFYTAEKAIVVPDTTPCG